MYKILSWLIIMIFLFSTAFAQSSYKNEQKVKWYKAIIEMRAWDILKSKTLSEKQSLLGKIERLRISYENKTYLSTSEVDLLNLLYAIEEYFIDIIPGIVEPNEQEWREEFQVLSFDILEDIKDNSYILWNIDAEITWIEYASLDEPFSAKLHNDEVLLQLNEKYDSQLNYVYQHFPLVELNSTAALAALNLECVAEQGWSESFYTGIDIFYKNYGAWYLRTLSELYLEMSDSIDMDVQQLECTQQSKYSDKISAQKSEWQELFWISGTPGNIIINNITGEYKIIPGAYPYQTFEDAIESLLTYE